MERGFYPWDQTFAGEKLLRNLAAQYGTPQLLYSREILEQRVNMLQRAFAWSRSFRQFFPVKVAGNPELLRILLRSGCGLLCSNALELGLAKRAGAREGDLLFTACFPGEADWSAAVHTGATLVLDDPEQLEHVPPERNRRPLGLRLRAAGAAGRPRGTGGSKFGMERQILLQTAVRVKELGFTQLGLLLHGVNLRSPGSWADNTRELVHTALEIQALTGLQIAWCDLGGGLFWDHKGSYTLDIFQEAAKIEEQFRGLDGIAVFTQLGRWLAAPAGVLLTEVRGVREDFVGTDTSMADLPRAALTGAQYHISVLGNSESQGRRSCVVTGWGMDRMDGLGTRRVLPPVRKGDLLVIHGAGAYSRSMASNYGASLRCPEILLEGGVPRLIRRRETAEEFLSGLND